MNTSHTLVEWGAFMQAAHEKTITGKATLQHCELFLVWSGEMVILRPQVDNQLPFFVLNIDGIRIALVFMEISPEKSEGVFTFSM
jgi:hypothetical protein